MMRTRHSFSGSDSPARARRESHRSRGGLQSAGRGFTLLELLIATTVGAIVLIVIQTTFFGALRLHNTTHQRIDEDLELQRALTIIRRDFAGLMLPGGTFTGQFQSESFSTLGTRDYGERITPDIVTSTGRIDGFNPFSDVQRVAYYLGAGADGRSGTVKNLVRVVTRNLLPVQETDDEGEEQVLLENVVSATVTFFDGVAWTDTWDSQATSTLPRALKLSLVRAPHESSQGTPGPIDLVVPVLVRTTTAEREDQEAATP